VLVASLSTGNKIGLAVMGAIFIAFALFSALIAPKRWKDYPGKGLSVFIVVSFALTALMLGAVNQFGVESEKASAEGVPKNTIDVSEKEWSITLPLNTGGKPGTYTFHVVNNGTVDHDFVVNGPGVAKRKTPTIPAGKSADLKVVLQKGTYDLYCSIDGHKALGMDAKLSVG
jgi:uncharacterized cupredoxin-like copper-binding protein